MQGMIADKRKIKSVQNDFAECEMWSVGSNGVTLIECYSEPGLYNDIPFLAIIKDGVVVERASALCFRIIYEE
jgi:hypothetical protein